MNANLELDPTQFSKEVLRLILANAQRWECSPQEALNRLLDSVASAAGYTPTPEKAA